MKPQWLLWLWLINVENMLIICFYCQLNPIELCCGIAWKDDVEGTLWHLFCHILKIWSEATKTELKREKISVTQWRYKKRIFFNETKHQACWRKLTPDFTPQSQVYHSVSMQPKPWHACACEHLHCQTCFSPSGCTIFGWLERKCQSELKIAKEHMLVIVNASDI